MLVAGPLLLVVPFIVGASGPPPAVAAEPVAPQVRSVPVQLTAAESTGAAADGSVVTRELALEGASLIGVTWSSAAQPPTVTVRARTGSTWGKWTPLDADTAHGPDRHTTEAEAARPGTEPLVVGGADAIQVRVGHAARVRDLRLELVAVAPSFGSGSVGRAIDQSWPTSTTTDGTSREFSEPASGMSATRPRPGRHGACSGTDIPVTSQ
jgi:hypothetical protein